MDKLPWWSWLGTMATGGLGLTVLLSEPVVRSLGDAWNRLQELMPGESDVPVGERGPGMDPTVSDIGNVI